MKKSELDIASNKILLHLAITMLRDLKRDDGVISYDEIYQAEVILCKAHDKYLNILTGFKNE